MQLFVEIDKRIGIVGFRCSTLPAKQRMQVVDVVFNHLAAGVHERDALEGFSDLDELLMLTEGQLAHQHLTTWPELEQSLLVQRAQGVAHRGLEIGRAHV